jgi:predicted nuclease with TOPRIM domain
MRDKLSHRIEQLKAEFQAGQAKLQELEIQQARLRETLLRISGAIQALEEMLQPEEGQAADGPAPPAEPSGLGQG